MGHAVGVQGFNGDPSNAKKKGISLFLIFLNFVCSFDVILHSL